jgi:Putative peptidoglycan binding domain
MRDAATLRSERTLRLTVPFTSGADVAALQRLLAPYHPGPVDGEYGPLTAAAVERAKWALGYPEERCDGNAEPALGTYLGGGPLPFDDAVRLNARAPDVASTLALRARIVGVARWGIAQAAEIHYAELRPIEGLYRPWQVPLRTDCSGFVTLCYAWAGAPDPNGLGYDGQGFTGTLIAHLRPVPLDGAQEGDLVVWGEPPGVHVALVLEPGSDPLLCSHGREEGPLETRFSDESRGLPGPATCLCLPPGERARAGVAPALGDS